jgi:hypothetical protein
VPFARSVETTAWSVGPSPAAWTRPDALAAQAIDRRGVRRRKTERRRLTSGEVCERLVGALPRFLGLTAGTDEALRDIERHLAGRRVRVSALEREHLELAGADEAELFVETDRRLVLDDHLQPHLGRAQRRRTVEQGAGEQLADPLATPGRRDSNTAQPGASSAATEVR